MKLAFLSYIDTSFLLIFQIIMKNIGMTRILLVMRIREITDDAIIPKSWSLNDKPYRLIPQERIIAGYCIKMNLIVAFQIIFCFSHKCAYSNRILFLPKILSTGIIKRIMQYITMYTKVDPRFFIRTLVENPFSSKYWFRA